MNDLIHHFDGLSVIVLRGDPLFPASAIEASLGYSPGRLGRMAREEWGAEFHEGRDFAYIGGDDLRAIKAAYAQTADSAVCGFAPNVNRVLAFTRRGVDLIAIKTDKPEGRALRAKMVDVVIPALRARGLSLADDAETLALGIGDATEPPTAVRNADLDRAIDREVELARAKVDVDRLIAEADLRRAEGERTKIEAQAASVSTDARRAHNREGAREMCEIAAEVAARGNGALAARLRVMAIEMAYGVSLAAFGDELAETMGRPIERPPMGAGVGALLGEAAPNIPEGKGREEIPGHRWISELAAEWKANKRALSKLATERGLRQAPNGRTAWARTKGGRLVQGWVFNEAAVAKLWAAWMAHKDPPGLTPTEAAERIGTSPGHVGKLVSRLGLKDDPEAVVTNGCAGKYWLTDYGLKLVSEGLSEVRGRAA